MLKKTIARTINFLKQINETSLWESLQRRHKIRHLAEEIYIIEKQLIARTDQEFMAYSLKKLFIIAKKQQQLLSKKN